MWPFRATKREWGRRSYAQCGEDLIVDFVFSSLRLGRLTYLDIGAHHPVEVSNTYLLYLNGHRGVCVEPDASFAAEFRRERPGDTFVQAGVCAGEGGQATFYRMPAASLSTFSPDVARRYEGYGQRAEEVASVPLVNVGRLMREHFPGGGPNFISLDVEDMEDVSLLRGMGLDRRKPEVLCVETLTYTEDKTERKITETIDFVCSRGYFVYADTFINTIFVLREAWAARPT